MLHLLEFLLEEFLQIPLGAARQNLGHESSARRQHIKSQIGRRLAEAP